MQTAVIAFVLLMIKGGETGRLLIVPRVYNALITSDEKLVPSQAYPAVSPVLRPAPSATHVFFPAQANSFQQENFQAPKLPIYNLPIDLTKPLVKEEVKNNRPSNPNIPDVPPPPLPVGRSKIAGSNNNLIYGKITHLRSSVTSCWLQDVLCTFLHQSCSERDPLTTEDGIKLKCVQYVTQPVEHRTI